MVTDAQYLALQQRVSELEQKLNNMSMQLNTLVLKNNKPTLPSNSKLHTRNTYDVTKYLFNCHIYCKRRLVLNVIKQYIADYQVKTFEELSTVFPDYIQGSMGVIKPIRQAERYQNATKRYYFSDEDVVLLGGEYFVVCSQWDAKNIHRFLDVATRYYDIEIINL